MIDFNLTESGDILMSAAFIEKSPIQIDFAISDSNAIMVEFYLTDFNQQKRSSTCIAFDITDKDEKAVSETVKDVDYIRQGIVMRLNTALGELKRRPEMGSKLESIKHHRLHETKTINAAREIATEAIKDLLPSAKITAEPSVSITSNGYEQNMNLNIYDEDLIIKYRMR